MLYLPSGSKDEEFEVNVSTITGNVEYLVTFLFYNMEKRFFKEVDYTKREKAESILGNRYGGITAPYGFQRALTDDEIWESMDRDDMVWNKDEQRWIDVQREGTIASLKQEYGSAWTQVMWG